jgi:hypothetical protein
MGQTEAEHGDNQIESKSARGGYREGAGRKPVPRLVVDSVTGDPKLSELLGQVRELFRQYQTDLRIELVESGGRTTGLTVTANIRLR